MTSSCLQTMFCTLRLNLKHFTLSLKPLEAKTLFNIVDNPRLCPPYTQPFSLAKPQVASLGPTPPLVMLSHKTNQAPQLF